MPRRSSSAPSAGRRTAAVLAAAVAVTAVAAPAAASAATKPAAAKVTLSQTKVSGQRIALRGRVALPSDSASQRRRTRVAFTLVGAKRATERFSAGVDARRAFALTRATKLSGRLSLTAQVTIAGRRSGRAVSRVVTVKAPARSGGGTTAPGRGGTTAPGAGGGTPAPGTTTPAPVPDSAVKLVGLFRFDEGISNPDGTHSGSWFRMFTPNGPQSPFSNADSRSRDKTYTLLRPGTDGGLRTDVYQEPPTPYFDEGGVRARRIIQQEKFFGANFTVFTQSKDDADGSSTKGAPTAIPEIFFKDGRLYGQTTAWTANWNGGPLFNQGSPKPDGSLPGYSRSLTGSYDPLTRRYTIEWTSQIVGGGFNFYSGIWHLEGTFEPSA